MNLTDQETLELNELCSALVDGAITDAQRARLGPWLRDSEAARQFYVRYLGLSASLMGYAGEMQSEQPDRAPPRVRGTWWIAALVASAAAVVAAAVTLWLSYPAARDGEVSVAEQEGDEFVARLTGGKDCEWTGRQTALKVGDHVRSGERLELAKGVAEITFDSGAQLVLEAATDLEVHSAWNATLHHGTLKASAPAQAVGFRVAGPTVDVVDLGTDFSMVAERDRMTEVYVLKGSVEATPRDDKGARQESVVLKEQQARRFGLREASEIRDKEQKIARFRQRVDLDRRSPPSAWVHWSFDEPDGPTAKSEVFGMVPASFDAVLENPGGQAFSQMRVDGRVQRALSLDGKSFVRATFPNISANVPRTVAFWVKVPVDADLSESPGMVSWGVKKSAPETVQIGWNRNPGQGVLGALRTEIGKRVVVGSVPLRDGNWHHVAVVFVPGVGEDAGTQVKQYVDGHLDGAGKRVRKHRPGSGASNEEAAVEVVWIGSRGTGARQERECFRGEIDELFMVEGSLVPREIMQLIGENKLARAGRAP
jgi:ferric-dicitrate binding protein FerR (iron transport regulator)